MRVGPITLLAPSLAFVAACSCGATHSPSDAASDAAWPIEPDIDVVGRWHDCASTLDFASDGTVTRTDFRAGCRGTGRWDVRGRTLEVAWDDAECVGVDRWARELVRAERGIVSVDLTDGRTNRWADDDHPFARFDLAGEAGQQTIARLVGTPGEGFGSGCYWSANGTCGGILSCSGVIGRWAFEGDRLAASTSCGGVCACGARLEGTRDERGVVTGSYHGANCETVLDGTFVATPSTDP